MFIPVKDLTINKIDKISVEELYKLLMLEKDIQIDELENGTEVLVLNNKDVKSESINGLTNIKNISRHKVTKDRWKISVKDKVIQTTGDHSIMVYRDGNVVEVRPEDIRQTDYLIVKKDNSKE